MPEKYDNIIICPYCHKETEVHVDFTLSGSDTGWLLFPTGTGIVDPGEFQEEVSDNSPDVQYVDSQYSCENCKERLSNDEIIAGRNEYLFGVNGRICELGKE